MMTDPEVINNLLNGGGINESVKSTLDKIYSNKIFRVANTFILVFLLIITLVWIIAFFAALIHLFRGNTTPFKNLF